MMARDTPNDRTRKPAHAQIPQILLAIRAGRFAQQPLSSVMRIIFELRASKCWPHRATILLT
jgi:hypothetical protein